MWQRIKQYFCNHDWTCNHVEGIPPAKHQLNTTQGFWEYATMYCSKCGQISDLSRKKLPKEKQHVRHINDL